LPDLRDAATRYLEETEKVFDWMNGNDLSADMQARDPEGFEHLSQAMIDLRAALEAVD